jgi:hypothetical protein
LAALDAEWPDDSNRARAVREAALEVAKGLKAAFASISFDDCSPERFLAIAEEELGPRFREEVPPALDTTWGGPKPDWSIYRQAIEEDIRLAMQEQQ